MKQMVWPLSIELLGVDLLVVAKWQVLDANFTTAYCGELNFAYQLFEEQFKKNE